MLKCIDKNISIILRFWGSIIHPTFTAKLLLQHEEDLWALFVIKSHDRWLDACNRAYHVSLIKSCDKCGIRMMMNFYGLNVPCFYWISLISKRNVLCPIDHFTVVCLVAWPLNESEAGGDLVLIETSLPFLCKFLLISMRTALLA